MALVAKGQTITQIKEAITLDGLRAALVLLMNDFLLSFNIPNSMNSTQVAECVDLLIMEFPHYTLEDFKVCFMYSKTARYGKVYARIDCAVVFDMFRAYDAERKDILATAQVKQHGEVKMLEKETPRVGWDKNQLSGIKNMINEIVAKEKAEKKVRIATPDEAKIRDNKWLRHFDKLLSKYQVEYHNGYKVSGKFIRRYGKIMAVTEFLHHKMKQLETVTKYLTERAAR